MNGNKNLLIDTNIIIYYLNGDPVATDHLEKNQNNLFISVISAIEVLSYPYTDEEDAIITDFLNQFHKIDLTDSIVSKTIEIRRTRKIKTPDAIIAATAMVENLTLSTRNTKDFNIVNLTIINPFR